VPRKISGITILVFLKPAGGCCETSKINTWELIKQGDSNLPLDDS